MLQVQAIGHMKKDCSQPKPDVGAAATSDSRMPVKSSDLVRFIVSVQPEVEDDDQLSGGEAMEAIVDTGCIRSLITQAALERVGVSNLVQPTSDDIVTINGEPLATIGSATLVLREDDDLGHSPTIVVSLLVVDRLDALSTDVVVGSDVISKQGGLHLCYNNGKVSRVVFGHDAPQGVAGTAVPKPKLSRHVDVSCSGEDVLLWMDDAEIRWLAAEGYWSVKWRWIDEQPPTSPIGSGIGKYARTQLSLNEETKFHEEVRMWMSNGWLVPYDEEQHGLPGAVLPLITVSQEHKPTTPVRPCLD